MRIRILRPALDDLAAARRFYDLQEPGVGGYFFDSLFSDIDSLVLYGGIHRVHFGFHRMLARRFPYAVYYRKDDEEVVVFRVLDCRRNPKWIRAQLEKHG